ncbi:MAG: enoyl-CoA hydratase [Blastopirellula sp.]|nr:MAG: enoyl-CoA hydratase [Blastopirellula sp.]
MQNKSVSLEYVGSDIAVVTMQDKVSKNAFSEELIDGLTSAFESIEYEGNCKAVILTGYDTYFASGGTIDSLLALHEGRKKFTDFALYELPLKCEVPVIAAMQGHGIGGGFVMGLFADFIVMSQEGVYTTNFMNYGFTPGFGSTYILKKKLGFGLAQEMLMSGGSYRGFELEKRGIPFAVEPRVAVMPRAMKIATSLSEKPRRSLKILKRHLVDEILMALPEIEEKELVMHKQTFHTQEVKERIETLYGK